jgi:hypothetical protein
LRKFLLIGALMATLAVPAVAAGDQWTVSQVSTGPSGGNSGDWTNLLDVTRDGSRILFTTAERLTPDDTDATMDLYLRSGSTLTLMSPDFGSSAGNISQDGSTLVFQTPDRLVPEDTDSAVDLYKRVGGTTTLLSIGPNGEHGPCQVNDFTSCNTFRAMSDDGQHVYFVSNGHLAPGDDEPVPCQQDPGGGVQTYACQDIYENWNGVTRLVSGGPADPRGPADYDLTYLSYGGATAYTARTDVSRDGKAFFQAQDPLLPEDTDSAGDVYQWSNGVLSLATAAASGAARITGISDDGSHLFYGSGAQIWDHTSTGDSARTPVVHWVDSFANSGDGSHIYIETQQSLLPEDTDGSGPDLYEQSSAGIKLITRGDTPSSPAINTQFLGSSRDGSKAYLSTSDQLVPYDTDDYGDDIYRYDSATGTKRIVSTGPTDFSGSANYPRWLATSEDGLRAFFETSAKFVSSDVNTSVDIYDWNSDTSITTLTPDWNGGIGCCGHTFTNERFVNDAGTKVVFMTDDRLRASDTDSTQDVYETTLTTPEPPGDPGFYAKPAGASPVRVSLVPTFQPCTAPNRQHGAPLAYGSCTPPTTPASHVTVDTGSQGKSVGFVRMDVIPGTNEFGDQADVKLYLLLGNVSWRANRLDYDGRVRATASLRLTDRTVAGTVQDVPWSFDAPCYVSDFDPVGSTCELGTTADAVLPGAVPEGARSIWQLGPIQIQDGGADGAPTTNPSDNRTFALQGVFVP